MALALALVGAVEGVGAGEGPADPNPSRLMFAPTARPLRAGQGYFSDHQLLFPGVALGITDHLSLAGGVSVLPGFGLADQIFYVAPKLGFQLSEKVAVAAGGFYGAVGPDDFGDLGAGYAVATVGPPGRSLTAGLGVGKELDTFAHAAPILLLGGDLRVARHVSLVGEGWIFLSGVRASQQPLILGVRFFNQRLSADVGFLVVRELLDEGLPIPWLSVTWHFGAGHGEGAARAPTAPYRPSLRRK
jgi:hypothetical protein